MGNSSTIIWIGDNMKFRDRIKELRKEKNITQEKLAKDLFLSKASISRYESGDQLPEIDMFEKLADYFDVSIDYLVGRTENKTSHKITRDDLPSILNELGFEYLEINEYIEEYKLSKDQLRNVLEQAVKLTQIRTSE